MLLDGALFELADDTWFEWTGLDEALDEGAALLAPDGACRQAEDRVWLTSGTLEVWELKPTAITRARAFENGGSATVRAGQVLALETGHLFLGPGAWKERSFAHGDATLLAAAGSYAWIVAGETLLRYDGETFLRVVAALPGPAVALAPHASGGVWVRTEDMICHLRPEEMLRVEGLRNGELLSSGALSMRVRAARPTSGVTATLDGEDFPAAFEEDGWFVFSTSVDVGWHAIELSAPGARRSLQVKRQPDVLRSYATDIQPIYNMHCSAATCHVQDSPSGAPDLSAYEAWIARAIEIRRRVVTEETMPPPSARNAEWGRDEVDIINEWLSGGMRP